MFFIQCKGSKKHWEENWKRKTDRIKAWKRVLVSTSLDAIYTKLSISSSHHKCKVLEGLNNAFNLQVATVVEFNKSQAMALDIHHWVTEFGEIDAWGRELEFALWPTTRQPNNPTTPSHRTFIELSSNFQRTSIKSHLKKAVRGLKPFLTALLHPCLWCVSLLSPWTVRVAWVIPYNPVVGSFPHFLCCFVFKISTNVNSLQTWSRQRTQLLCSSSSFMMVSSKKINKPTHERHQEEASEHVQWLLFSIELFFSVPTARRDGGLTCYSCQPPSRDSTFDGGGWKQRKPDPAHQNADR